MNLDQFHNCKLSAGTLMYSEYYMLKEKVPGYTIGDESRLY
jgi:hypothetical protein